MGRALFPSPFFSTVAVCGLTILDAGTESQKKQFLTAIANGDMVLTLALAESAGRYDAAEIAAHAVKNDGKYTLTGTKLFVPDAHVADWVLCAARTGKSHDPEKGITIFMTERSTHGLTCSVLPTLSKEKQCEVVFDHAAVPAENILGYLDQGWPVLNRTLQRAAVAKSVEMVGGAQQVLEMTVTYAKERVQFDKPIGTFQAIQHHCANMAIDVDSSRYLAYLAAWKISEGQPCDMEVAVAKAWAGEAYKRISVLGHQVHGAIGFTLDHDMQLSSRRAKAAEGTFGDAHFHRAALARQVGAQHI